MDEDALCRFSQEWTCLGNRRAGQLPEIWPHVDAEISLSGPKAWLPPRHSLAIPLGLLLSTLEEPSLGHWGRRAWCEVGISQLSWDDDSNRSCCSSLAPLNLLPLGLEGLEELRCCLWWCWALLDVYSMLGLLSVCCKLSSWPWGEQQTLDWHTSFACWHYGICCQLELLWGQSLLKFSSDSPLPQMQFNVLCWSRKVVLDKERFVQCFVSLGGARESYACSSQWVEQHSSDGWFKFKELGEI